MKICHLSDLHLEFGLMEVPKSDADVIVLSGDIHIGTQGIDWASQFDVPVIYVLGNHEAYGTSLDSLIDQCRVKANGYEHVHLLENDSIVIEGVRFHGCTLWTDFCLDGSPDVSMKIAEDRMNDFKQILYHGNVFTPQDTQSLHRESRRWLYNSVKQSPEPNNVIVTHHLPSRSLIQVEYLGSPLAPAFASHCGEFESISNKIAVWCYGHNHDCNEQIDFGINFHTNQRGYVEHELVSGFNPQKIITIDTK
ncbi:metallophosphoesterase [Vibrio parahaemolyticus]|nr:metallophosphoesterase [Vibrio parahaemolyticus]MBE4250993.1 metallophosphoesterase [Vibrio parahaemolyticus]MBE4255723.1 metallophosphoesterase [Vibrio parahaemolyticus]